MIMRLLEVNGIKDINYVEPFTGGASLALALLFGEYASTVHINDLSRSVYSFWYSALNDTKALCERVEKTEVTITEWHRQRDIYEHEPKADLLDLGFAALF